MDESIANMKEAYEQECLENEEFARDNIRLRKIVQAQDEELDEAKREINRLTRQLKHSK